MKRFFTRLQKRRHTATQCWEKVRLFVKGETLQHHWECCANSIHASVNLWHANHNALMAPLCKLLRQQEMMLMATDTMCDYKRVKCTKRGLCQGRLPTLPCQPLTFSHTGESLIVGICCELHHGGTSATGSLQHGTDWTSWQRWLTDGCSLFMCCD